MDPVRNPFAPGAGNPPPELAGRAAILGDIDVAFRRLLLGKPARSSIMVGLRGVGKTVLLVKMQEIAHSMHYKSLSVEAHEGKSLPDLLVPGLRSILFSLSTFEASKQTARRGLRVLKSFLNGLKITAYDVEVGISIDPEIGAAASGKLESDLPALFVSIAEAARFASLPVVILIDELQYFSSEEFSALIMSIHKINQLNLPLIVVGAGLPQIPGLAGESKSYSERLFRFPQVGALSEEEAKEAILKPANSEGVHVEPDALGSKPNQALALAA